MSHRLTSSTPGNRDSSQRDDERFHVLSLGCIIAVALSVIESALGYVLLSTHVRIHWSLGFPYYGPEFAPKVVLLSLFPAVIIATALGSYWIAGWLLAAEGFAEFRSYYAFAVFGLLTFLLGIQGFIIVANL